MPKINWEYSTSEVLTMEYCPGIKINRTAELDRLGLDRVRLARLSVECYLQQLVRTFLRSNFLIYILPAAPLSRNPPAAVETRRTTALFLLPLPLVHHWCDSPPPPHCGRLVHCLKACMRSLPPVLQPRESSGRRPARLDTCIAAPSLRLRGLSWRS